MRKLESVIATTFKIPIQQIEGDIVFKDLESWDSLTHMEFIVAIEMEFNVELTAEEIVEMTSKSKAEEILKNKAVVLDEA